MAKPIQPVSIDGIEFDALIESSKTYENDVPTYPVEENYEISDSIIHKAIPLNMTLFLTNTGVTWRDRIPYSPSRVQEVLEKLEDLYFKNTPVTIVTSEETYQNMAIVSMELSKKLETGTSRQIPISFRQIRVTESATTTIPAEYGKSGVTGANAGTANTTSSDVPGASGSSSSKAAAEDGNGSLGYFLGGAAGLYETAGSSNLLGGVGNIVSSFLGE